MPGCHEDSKNKCECKCHLLQKTGHVCILCSCIPYPLMDERIIYLNARIDDLCYTAVQRLDKHQVRIEKLEKLNGAIIAAHNIKETNDRFEKIEMQLSSLIEMYKYISAKVAGSVDDSLTIKFLKDEYDNLKGYEDRIRKLEIKSIQKYAIECPHCGRTIYS